MALEFAGVHWREGADLDDMRVQCPKGYGPFEGAVIQEFRRAIHRQGRLF